MFLRPLNGPSRQGLAAARVRARTRRWVLPSAPLVAGTTQLQPAVVRLAGPATGSPAEKHRPSPDGSLVSEQAQPGPSEGSPAGSDIVALTRSPGFWVIIRYAALFGVVLAFAALAYLGLVKGGTNLSSRSRRTRLV